MAHGFFQTLEDVALNFSKPWKKSVPIFQGLENHFPVSRVAPVAGSKLSVGH